MNLQSCFYFPNTLYIHEYNYTCTFTNPTYTHNGKVFFISPCDLASLLQLLAQRVWEKVF